MKKITFLLSIFLISFALSGIASEQIKEDIKGNIANGEKLSSDCIACHGVEGNSTIASFPKIAGQGATYIVKQLQDFKSGMRENASMSGVIATLSEQDMLDLAAYYSVQTISDNIAKTDTKSLELARKIYLGGKKEVTACIACHGPQGKGIPSAKFPAISGQHAEYNANQLKKFRQYTLNIILEQKEEERANDYANMMRYISKYLTNQEIDALAQYIAGLH